MEHKSFEKQTPLVLWSVETVISYEERQHLQALLFPLQAKWHVQSMAGMVSSKHPSKEAGLQITPLAVLQASLSMIKCGEYLQHGAAVMCRKSEGDFESRRESWEQTEGGDKKNEAKTMKEWS